MNQLKKSNFDKFPAIKIDGYACIEGWKNITGKLQDAYSKLLNKKTVIAIECYPGVYTHEIAEELQRHIPNAMLFDASAAMQQNDEIEQTTLCLDTWLH